jgi:hypothetical protein
VKTSPTPSPTREGASPSHQSFSLCTVASQHSILGRQGPWGPALSQGSTLSLPSWASWRGSSSASGYQWFLPWQKPSWLPKSSGTLSYHCTPAATSKQACYSWGPTVTGQLQWQVSLLWAHSSQSQASTCVQGKPREPSVLPGALPT